MYLLVSSSATTTPSLLQRADGPSSKLRLNTCWGVVGVSSSPEALLAKVSGVPYLDQPGLQLVVDDDVVAVAFKAMLVVVHHWLQSDP